MFPPNAVTRQTPPTKAYHKRLQIMLIALNSTCSLKTDQYKKQELFSV